MSVSLVAAAKSAPLSPGREPDKESTPIGIAASSKSTLSQAKEEVKSDEKKPVKNAWAESEESEPGSADVPQNPQLKRPDRKFTAEELGVDVTELE